MTRYRLLPGLLLFFTAALALPGSGKGQAKKETGKKYALVVGVRHYKKGELRNLSSADRDAKGLANLLKGAGYRRVVLMTYDSAADNVDLLPTARNIKEQLKSLLEDCEKEDSVIVGFIGHGVQPAGSKDHLLC